MPFPKLTSHLQAALERQGFEASLPLLDKVLAPIKSGVDILCIGPEDSGKTIALVISVIQALGSKAEGEAPRALIFVKDKVAALELEEAFAPFIFRSDLRVYSAFDQHEIYGQRDTIYDGVDILIGTPSRLSKLFLMNGVNLARLRMLIIEDAQFLQKTSANAEIIRFVESGHRFQKLLFAEELNPRIEQLRESIMPRAKRLSQS